MAKAAERKPRVRLERDFQRADDKPLGRADFSRLDAERDRTREDAIACSLAAADDSAAGRDSRGVGVRCCGPMLSMRPGR